MAHEFIYIDNSNNLSRAQIVVDEYEEILVEPNFIKALYNAHFVEGRSVFPWFQPCSAQEDVVQILMWCKELGIKDPTQYVQMEFPEANHIINSILDDCQGVCERAGVDFIVLASIVYDFNINSYSDITDYKYFIFGSHAIRSYEQDTDSFNKNGEFNSELHRFKALVDPNDVIAAYDGYEGSIEITFEEYVTFMIRGGQTSIKLREEEGNG